MRIRLLKTIIYCSIVLTLGSLLISCKDNSIQGKVLLTAIEDPQLVDVYTETTGVTGLPGASIIAIDPEQEGVIAKVISNGFYSACFPDVSYNGQKMIFTGQLQEGDVWQIFEMDLNDLSSQQLTNAEFNCSEPKYLPGGRVVYSQDVSLENQAKRLMVLQEGYKESRQITFSPNSYSGTTVLHDGRIISFSQPSYESTEGNIMVMRPDGTKEMLFYKSEEARRLIGKPREIGFKRVLALEKDENGKNVMFNLDYNDPLHSKFILSDHLTGDFAGIGTSYQNNILFCYKPSSNHNYGLYVFDMTSDSGVTSLYDDPDYHFVDAVFVGERNRPKNIPSEVNMEHQTGLLLCQDINFSGYGRDTAEEEQKAVKIEILGLNASLGVVDAEADGSVYLKIKADTPFRIQTLDDEGTIVKGPSEWINLRPNERRACVGCHQGNELVPENRQPLSVLKDPIEIPLLEQLMATN